MQVPPVTAEAPGVGWATATVTTTTLPNPTSTLGHSLWLAVKDSLSLLTAEWQLWSLVAVVLLAVLVIKLHDARRLVRSGIAEVDRMDGRTFEEYVGVLFRRLGYSAEATPYSGDYGADLVVRREGVRHVVQAKRSRRPVGPRAVQEVVGARPHYRCQGAVVVTNSKFTAAARRLAADSGVKLWRRRSDLDKRRQWSRGSRDEKLGIVPWAWRARRPGRGCGRVMMWR